MLTQRGGFLSLIKVRMSLKVAEVSWRSGGCQEVGSQEASRGSQVAAKSWPVKSGPAAARGQPPKRQLPPKQQTRGQVLVPRAVAKWQPEVAPSQAVAKRPRSLILKWLLKMLTG